VAELPPGARKVVAAGPFGIGVFNLGGTLHAVINRCPHQGAQVCRGRLTGTTQSFDHLAAAWSKQGEILQCPWHGWQFDLATGREITVHGRRLKKFPVHVIDGEIVVELPQSYAPGLETAQKPLNGG
jgi:nitrite reductase (NADH) small subunit